MTSPFHDDDARNVPSDENDIASIHPSCSTNLQHNFKILYTKYSIKGHFIRIE